jgi:hypothetical protein
MTRTSRLVMKKFNGTNFELWKLNIEDFPIDQDLWVTIYKTKPVGMEYEE